MKDRGTKPKRLRLETSIDTEGQANGSIYEVDASRFLFDLNTRPIRRPLPAINAMLTTAPQRRNSAGSRAGGKNGNDDVDEKQREVEERTGSKMPLLSVFFEASKRTKRRQAEMKNGQSDEGDDISGGGKQILPNGDDERCPLDKFSVTLTRGHHKRFRELLAVFGKNANSSTDKHLSYKDRMSRKKEFRVLCDLFREERRMYGQALEDFRRQNSDRFRVGFKGELHVSNAVSEAMDRCHIQFVC